LSISQMSARFAAGKEKLGATIRQGQDAIQRRDGAQARLRAMIEHGTDSRMDAIAAIQAEIKDQERNIAALQETISRQFPDYGRIARAGILGDAETMSLLRKLDQDCRARRSHRRTCAHALVSFHVSSAGTIVWAFTAEKREASQSSLTEKDVGRYVAALRCGVDHTNWDAPTTLASDGTERRLEKQRAQARRQYCVDRLGAQASAVWDEAGNLVQPPRFDAALAHEFYRALLGGVDALIKDKHVLVVPVGPLTSLPFDVLVTQPPKTAQPATAEDYRQVAWLGLWQPITVLPSVWSLRSLRQFAKVSQAPEAFLGFGDPLLDGPDASFQAAAAQARANQNCAALSRPGQTHAAHASGGFALLGRGGRADIEKVRSWPPLPETAIELCDIRERLGVPNSAIILGARATEGQVKSLSEDGTLSRHRILHFATHAAVAGELDRAAEPGLILTPPQRNASDGAMLEQDDGFLTASEIATLKLDADWVVLSACNTAAAAEEGAEALSGVARAFLYAGARALLVSHWEVNSAAAVRLTTRTFAELKANPGIARAEALRVAMRDMVENGTGFELHPALWAPFVVIGDPGGLTAAQRTKK
jgi:CHAT domain-containing protein